MNAIIKIRKDTNLNVRMVVEGYALSRFGLVGNEDYILPMNPPMSDMFSDEAPETFDIHAGAIETSSMNYCFPKLVKTDIAKNLQSRDLTWEELKIWSKGGDETRNLVPLGYAGSPANFEKEKNLNEMEEFLSNFAAQCIFDSLN